MLLGTAAMIALMRNRDDDAGLIVVPAVERNPRALPQRRFGAVRSNQQIGKNRRAVAELDRDAFGAIAESSYCARAQLGAALAQALNQHIDQMAVLDHMGKGLRRSVAAVGVR